MSVWCSLSVEGDARMTWEPVAAEAGGEVALAALRVMESAFLAHQRRGGIWVRLAPGHPAERVDRFDAGAFDELVGLPAVVGG